MTSGDPGDGETGELPSQVDARMAEILATTGDGSTRALRRKLADEASGESEELLARVNALEFLDTVVGELGSELPERLGSYRIIGVLGRGGMGTVFDAFDETLERVVALKLLAPGLTADPRMRRRFRTEARASATLHHQHIVPIYGYGESAGHLFFAMERVDGISLDRHVSNSRRRERPFLEPGEAARRFAGVADALSHAHRRGILHRDVKPGNILVHPDGSFALADFGLSKIAGEQSVSVSQHGGFLGTLHYAAPEQARGMPVNEASDLYSLGVTMYEVISGRLPFDGSTTEAILQALLYEECRPLRRDAPKATRDLELVLEKLLAKDPEDRYSDAEHLARDLQRVADDEPVAIRRRSAASRAWRWARKHRSLSMLGAVAVLLLAVVLVLTWQGVLREESARKSRHDILIANAMTEAERDPGWVGGPSNLLRALLGVDLEEPLRSPVLDVLDSAAKLQPESESVGPIRDAFLDDPLPAATAALRAGRGYVALRMLDERIATTEASSSYSSRDTTAGLRLYRLYFARAIAQLTASVGDPDAAARDLIRASMMRRGAFAPRLLFQFVDWRPDAGVATLARAIDGLLESTEIVGGRRIAALLLRLVAAPQRPIEAHLVDFEFTTAVRRQLFDLARRLDAQATSTSFDSVATAESGALEAALAAAARRAAALFGNESQRRDALAAIDTALSTEVAPLSPLQSWRVVHAFLEDPDAIRFGRRVGAFPLPPLTVLRGLRDLIELDLPSEVLGRLDGVHSTLLAQLPDSPHTLALRARFAERVGSDSSAALDAAESWVRLAPDDADAWLCRLRCRLATRPDLDWIAVDGARVLQLALDRGAAARAIVDVLDAAAARDGDPDRSQALRDLAGKFHASAD